MGYTVLLHVALKGTDLMSREFLGSEEPYPVLKGAEEHANNWRALAVRRKEQLDLLQADLVRYEDAIREIGALPRDHTSPEVFDRAVRDIVQRVQRPQEVHGER